MSWSRAHTLYDDDGLEVKTGKTMSREQADFLDHWVMQFVADLEWIKSEACRYSSDTRAMHYTIFFFTAYFTIYQQAPYFIFLRPVV